MQENKSGCFFSEHRVFYGRQLSVSGRPCYILPMFIYLFIFYGRLILRPWLTEVRVSFTRGGSWVSLEKLLLGFFPGHPWTTGWAKKWRNLAYFQTPPANFLLSRPNAAEYCNIEKIQSRNFSNDTQCPPRVKLSRTSVNQLGLENKAAIKNKWLRSSYAERASIKIPQ